jgi:hypothetical protein
VGHAALDGVRAGWKVFEGAREIGQVEQVGAAELVVGWGRLRRRHYHVPAEYVTNAAEGLVDLSIGREAIERLEVHR